MKRNQVLTELYNSRELADLLTKMQPENLREDIKQELFIVLCELPEAKLLGMAESKQLRFFATRVILNMVKSKTSRFYYQFRKQVHVELPDMAGTPDDGDFTLEQFEQDYADKLAATLAAKDKLNWYQQEILEQYILHGSAGKMVKDMQARLGGNCIPKRSILHTVKEATTQIRNQVNKNK